MKDKTYNCKDCGRKIRAKMVAMDLIMACLCEECYTERLANRNKDGHCEFCGVKLEYNKNGEIVNKDKCSVNQ